jgi:hypothetical protein
LIAVITSRYAKVRSPQDVQNAVSELFANAVRLSGLLPVGALLPSVQSLTDDAPEGWLIADGREVASKDYPELAKKIGRAYGTAVGTDNFVLPDLRGAYLRGASSDPASTEKAGSADTVAYDSTAVATLSVFFVTWLIKAA